MSGRYFDLRRLLRTAWAVLCAGICIVALLATGPAPVIAQDASTQAIGRVRVGFDGVYKVGFWTPVDVELGALDQAAEHDPAMLEVIVPDGDGVPSQVSHPITAADLKAGRARLLVKFGRVHSWLHVQIRQSGRIVAKRKLAADKSSADFRPALPATARLVVCVGSPLLSNEARRKHNALAKIEFVQLADAEQLPRRWFGYTGIDALWLSSSWFTNKLDKRGENPATSITHTQIAAIERWVQLGGQLVLSVGTGGQQMLASDSSLTNLAPGKLRQVVELPLAAAFETYVGAAYPLAKDPGQAARLMISVASLADVRGNVELAADGIPLVVRTKKSFGSIVFVAVDLSTSPFIAWNGQPEMIALVLGQTLAGQQAANETTPPQSLYSDLSGQLRAALDQFEGVAVFSRFAGLIFALIAVYALIIGPLDYLMVRRVFKRTRLTWITFPVLLVLASGVAYALVDGIKGREPKINQVDLVDIDAATGVTRGVNWTHAYSPASGEVRFDFRFRPREGAVVAKDAKIVASWMGLPGRGLGGMNPSIVDTNTISTPYQFSPHLDGLTAVPIAAASSKSLIARWHSQTKPLVAADLRATQNSSLFENCTLTWNADFTLPSAYLLHDRWAYRLGDLQPHSKLDLKPSQRSSAAAKLLDYRRIDGKQVATPFELDNLDTLRIVKSLMFHEASGGASYTAGLENRYLHTLDMSGLLRSNTAILVGQPTDAVLDVNFQLAGEQLATQVATRHWSILRIVLPVKVVER